MPMKESYIPDRIGKTNDLPGRMQFAYPFRRVNARAFFAVVSRPCIDHNERVI